MNSSRHALLVLSDDLHNTHRYSEVRFGGRLYRLAREMKDDQEGVVPIDGCGGFKKVFGLPNGLAIAIPNLDALKLDAEQAEIYAEIWERAIHEEKMVSDNLRELGLEAQYIEIHPLEVGDAILPVMVMQRFVALEEAGMQVRDVKNSASSVGSTMIFGTPQNVEDPSYLATAMQGVLDDAVTLIKNGLSFGNDTVNLIIKDTAHTPPHDRTELGGIDARQQEARLFFFDFSSKHGARTPYKLKLLDANGGPDAAAIAKLAEHTVDQAYQALTSGVRFGEILHILEQKKTFPSEVRYNNPVNIYNAFDESYEAVIEDLVCAVTARATEAIGHLPLRERAARFLSVSGEEIQIPTARADGRQWGDALGDRTVRKLGD